jgi:hypothetical protein
MILTGYKICSITKDGNQKIKYSSYVNDLHALVYSKKKWTRPKKHCGPLAVFANYRDAEVFFEKDCDPKYQRHYQIKKCVYRKSRYTSLWINEKIPCFWAPSTTVYASSVKLL